MGNQEKSLVLWNDSVCYYFLKMQKTEARSLINNNYNIISNKFAMHTRVVTQILVDFDFVEQELNFSVETPFNQI